MEHVKIIKRNRQPLYNMAIDAVSELITSGQFHPGDRLPPEGELAQQLGISRSTLREAVGYLESRGIVYRRHGVGIFISNPAHLAPQRGLDEIESFSTIAQKIGVSYERLLWKVDTITASSSVADALGTQPGAAIVRAEMSVALNGHPYAYLDGYILPQYVNFTDLQEYPDGSLLDYCVDRAGINFTHSASKIMATTANAEIAQLLNVSENFALLYMNEIFQSQDGKPLVVTLNYFNTQILNFFLIRRIVHS
jgi:GntR family transcriptional regulator